MTSWYEKLSPDIAPVIWSFDNLNRLLINQWFATLWGLQVTLMEFARPTSRNVMKCGICDIQGRIGLWIIGVTLCCALHATRYRQKSRQTLIIHMWSSGTAMYSLDNVKAMVHLYLYDPLQCLLQTIMIFLISDLFNVVRNIIALIISPRYFVGSLVLL